MGWLFCLLVSWFLSQVRAAQLLSQVRAAHLASGVCHIFRISGCLSHLYKPLIGQILSTCLIRPISYSWFTSPRGQVHCAHLAYIQCRIFLKNFLSMGYFPTVFLSEKYLFAFWEVILSLFWVLLSIFFLTEALRSINSFFRLFVRSLVSSFVCSSPALDICPKLGTLCPKTQLMHVSWYLKHILELL